MRTAFIDLHTHRIKTCDNLIQIVNLDLNQSCPEHGCFSYGIHPCVLDNADFQAKKALQALEEKLKLPQVLALGEAGLDKMHKASFKQQIELFERQIELSEALQKPMILHDVRSHNEIIALRKKHKAQQPWILHGFSGTDKMCDNSSGKGLNYPWERVCCILKERFINHSNSLIWIISSLKPTWRKSGLKRCMKLRQRYWKWTCRLCK